MPDGRCASTSTRRHDCPSGPMPAQWTFQYSPEVFSGTELEVAKGPAQHVGPDPEAAPLEAQGLGWSSSYASGKGADAITSGLEVTWTTTPTRWSNDFFEILFKYEWEQTTSPAGAIQWVAKGADAIIPGPTPGAPKRKPTMLKPSSKSPSRFSPWCCAAIWPRAGACCPRRQSRG